MRSHTFCLALLSAGTLMISQLLPTEAGGGCTHGGGGRSGGGGGTGRPGLMPPRPHGAAGTRVTGVSNSTATTTDAANSNSAVEASSTNTAAAPNGTTTSATVNGTSTSASLNTSNTSVIYHGVTPTTAAEIQWPKSTQLNSPTPGSQSFRAASGKQQVSAGKQIKDSDFLLAPNH